MNRVQIHSNFAFRAAPGARNTWLPRQPQKSPNQRNNLGWRLHIRPFVHLAIPFYESHSWAKILKSCSYNGICAYVNGFPILTEGPDVVRLHYTIWGGENIGWVDVLCLNPGQFGSPNVFSTSRTGGRWVRGADSLDESLSSRDESFNYTLAPLLTTEENHGKRHAGWHKSASRRPPFYAQAR